MQRGVVLVILLWVTWRVLSTLGTRRARDTAGAESFSRFSARRRDLPWRRQPSQPSDVALVACARCALHVPASSTVERDGHTYCSDACADGD